MWYIDEHLLLQLAGPAGGRLMTERCARQRKYLVEKWEITKSEDAAYLFETSSLKVFDDIKARSALFLSTIVTLG